MVRFLLVSAKLYLYTNCSFASSGFDGNDFVLNISGGQLALSKPQHYSDIIDAIQVRYDGSIISGVIDSVISINTNTVKLKLNWDNIFASGVSLDDYIDINYDPDGASVANPLTDSSATVQFH